MQRLLRRMIAGATSLSVVVAPLAARANPLNGNIAAGNATIAGEGTSQVTVTQTTPRAIINWRSFDIAPGETTQFTQPNAASVILNRVTGGLGASTINGMIKANGGVYVVNPDGILFGPSAVVNTGSFLATTHDIRNDDFMAGRYNFNISGNPGASIVNQGIITAATGGFASLVAPGVRNDGIITARLGTVSLASGNGFTLDLYGDSLIKLQPSDVIAAQVRDVVTGLPLTSLVRNTGKLKANGGTVVLSAVAARQIVDSVINTSGVIQANTVRNHSGRVIFGAATAGARPADAPRQVVKVSGKISASGKKPGAKGGLVQITGEDIQLSNAAINASGNTGGGTILIGGDYHGGNPDPSLLAQYGISLQPWTIPTATAVAAESTVMLNASALSAGNGGKIVVWSDDTTTFNGSLLARGGVQTGNGGFAEVSGRNTVNYQGIIADLSSRSGRPGTILFDPTIEIIDPIKAASISSILSVGTNVLETADEINVNASIVKTGTPVSSLTFSSTLLSVADNVTIGSTGGPLNIAIAINPIAVSDEVNTLIPIIQSWRSAGLSPADLQIAIQNHNLNAGPPGTGSVALTYKVLNDLAASTPDSLKSSFFYKALSSNSITVGMNVQLYTAGGTLSVEKRDGTVNAFEGGLILENATINCSTLPCGQFITIPNTQTNSIHVEWTDHITPPIIENRTIFNFTPSSSSLTYRITGASTAAGVTPLTAEYPSLAVSFGAASTVPVQVPPIPEGPPPGGPTPIGPMVPQILAPGDQQALLFQNLGNLYAYLTSPDGAPGSFDLFGGAPSNPWSTTSRPSDNSVLPDWQAYWNSPEYRQSESSFVTETTPKIISSIDTQQRTEAAFYQQLQQDRAADPAQDALMQGLFSEQVNNLAEAYKIAKDLHEDYKNYEASNDISTVTGIYLSTLGRGLIISSFMTFGAVVGAASGGAISLVVCGPPCGLAGTWIGGVAGAASGSSQGTAFANATYPVAPSILWQQRQLSQTSRHP